MILEPFFRKWLQNDQFEQGFIRVCATRFCILKNSKFVRFYKVFRRSGNALRKPSLGNAFLMVSELFSRKWLGNDQFEQGFIRVSATRFCILEKAEFDRFYKGFRRSEKALRKPSLGNAFLYFLMQFCKNGSKMLHKRHVL